MTEEEVVKPDRIGSMDPDVVNWRPPSHHTRQTMKRVFQIRQWIERENRLVEEEEIIRYAMRHFGVDRQAARQYLKQVVEDFRRAGVLVIDQSS